MFLSYSPENQWMTVTEWLSFLCWDLMYEALYYIYLFNSISQWYMCCFNHLLDLKYWFHISGLVKFICERSLSRKKSQFLSEVVFVVTLRLPSTTFGIFWVLTTWMQSMCDISSWIFTFQAFSIFLNHSWAFISDLGFSNMWSWFLYKTPMVGHNSS